MRTRKKLIEVALPLEAINKAAAWEKGNPFIKDHPRNLHHWWARRPLCAARAVIFAQMADDPSEYVDALRSDPQLTRKAEAALKGRMKLWEEARALADRARGTTANVPEPGPPPTLDDVLADLERQRLFKIIEDLVEWENTTHETVLQTARDEIWQSWRRTCAENADHPRAEELFDREKLPAFHDPFAGGAALPLEAQRLGLETYASDLNPVAVLINKAMVEIPPKFAGLPPINPTSSANDQYKLTGWRGAQGIAEDVRHYGKWMRDEAEKRINHLYPKIEVTTEMLEERPDLKPYLGQRLAVIAWLWVRTVKSPDPAFATVDVPLASTFMLSTNAGKEVYVEPVLSGADFRFRAKAGKPKDVEQARNGTKLARGSFRCVMSGAPITGEYIKGEGQSGRIGTRLMAIVAEGIRGRVYISPTLEHEAVAREAIPEWKPDIEFFQQALGFRVGNYGMTKWSDLFTNRQLVALSTFVDLIGELTNQVRRDANAVGFCGDSLSLEEGGKGSNAYAEAITIFLACAISQISRYCSSLAKWNAINQNVAQVFGLQTIQMVWDFAEANVAADALGISAGSNWVANALGTVPAAQVGFARQEDARIQRTSNEKVVSTDPPYFDNVGYADLSDYFYVWLRRSLRTIFPALFTTLVVPKAEELVATPARHGGAVGAEMFFLDGMTQAMCQLAERAHPTFPVTIYYAFKQSEDEKEGGAASTGWETFLEALGRAGLATVGTWPVRTERPGRLRETGSNALASSIVLVCRRRDVNAPTATRREFVLALKSELPTALRHLQEGNIAPVDLAQAAIGPGMAVYTRYSKVFDAEGKPVAVREALALINQILDESLAEQEGDFDADSRWALTWFEQLGFAEGEYGVAEQLSKSKNTSVTGMVEAGIVESSRGRVRLLKPSELPGDWNPATDPRLTAWEVVHHLIRVLESGGEAAAAQLVSALGAKAEVARELAYRLYTLCERKKRATEALAYNGLVQSWPEIMRLSEQVRRTVPEQVGLFGNPGE